MYVYVPSEKFSMLKVNSLRQRSHEGSKQFYAVSSGADPGFEVRGGAKNWMGNLKSEGGGGGGGWGGGGWGVGLLKKVKKAGV